MEFRKDINGLRAIAVLCVLFYHFNLSGFSGGFIGVDVFFVISGFLMTGIILTSLEMKRFSLWRFYVARARRIIPALMGLCITLLALGWFWLPPTDYGLLGKHAANALIFSSNFIFKREAGYFDSFSQDKWLLHTWSLSVEWQFYVILPLVLAALYKWTNRKFLYTAICLMALASFIVSVVATPSKPTFAFFILPARAWELLAGSLSFIIARRLTQLSPICASTIHFLALTLIAISVLVFTSSSEWPGYAALLPVLAAAVIISLPQPQKSPLLSNVLQHIGLWSYSIYIWHWPVFVALKHAQLETNLLWLSLGIAGSILLGYFSYRFIETPFRSSSSKKITLRPAIAVLTILSLTTFYGFAAREYDGFPHRVSPRVAEIEAPIKQAEMLRPKTCKEGDLFSSYPECKNNAAPHYAVLGDSHAGAAFAGVYDASGNQYGIGFIKSCPLLKGGYLLPKNKSAECPKFTDAALSAIDALPKNVPLIVISRLSYYIHGYNEHPKKKVQLGYLDVPDMEVSQHPENIFIKKTVETLCQMTANGRRVYVMQPIPEIGIEVPKALSRQMMFQKDIKDVSISLADYNKRHHTALIALRQAQKNCGVHLLDPVPYLCSNDTCYGSKNGTPYYYDDDHLSLAGALKLSPLFRTVFKRH